MRVGPTAGWPCYQTAGSQELAPLYSRAHYVRAQTRRLKAVEFSFCDLSGVLAQVEPSLDATGEMPVGPTAKMAVLHIFQQFASFSYTCTPDLHHLFILALVVAAVVSI